MGMYDYLRFILALAFVLALMGLVAYGLRRFGLDRLSLGGPAKKRLSVLETRLIDHRHKLVLVACDGREHLLLLGPQGQTVIHQLAPPLPSAPLTGPEKP